MTIPCLFFYILQQLKDVVGCTCQGQCSLHQAGVRSGGWRGAAAAAETPDAAVHPTRHSHPAPRYAIYTPFRFDYNTQHNFVF